MVIPKEGEMIILKRWAMQWSKIVDGEIKQQGDRRQSRVR